MRGSLVSPSDAGHFWPASEACKVKLDTFWVIILTLTSCWTHLPGFVGGGNVTGGNVTGGPGRTGIKDARLRE